MLWRRAEKHQRERFQVIKVPYVWEQCLLACWGAAVPWLALDNQTVMKHGRNSFWMNSLLVNTHSLSFSLSVSLSVYLCPPPTFSLHISLPLRLFYLFSASCLIYDNDIIQSGKQSRWPAVKERNLWHEQYILQAVGRSNDDPTVAVHPAAHSCTAYWEVDCGLTTASF